MSSEMIDVSVIVVPSVSVVMLASLAGAWILKRKTKTPASRLLLLFVILATVWLPAIKLSQWAVFRSASGMTEGMFRFHEISELMGLYGFCAFAVAAALSFLMAAVGMSSHDEITESDAGPPEAHG